MPITKSAKKAARRSLKLQKRNFEFKLRMKMAIKKFKKSAEKGEKLTQKDLNTVYKYIDKCTKIGLIKKKNGSRKKSNVAKLLSSTNTKSDKKVETKTAPKKAKSTATKASTKKPTAKKETK
ncbi:MAG TPA: 30S ribosomal protein S20 [Candidatus Absconditabacterales bacterium]|nr:30S ribosomal protein S20 [Candidatus Absconditabacterales bacterium]